MPQVFFVKVPVKYKGKSVALHQAQQRSSLNSKYKQGHIRSLHDQMREYARHFCVCLL